MRVQTRPSLECGCDTDTCTWCFFSVQSCDHIYRTQTAFMRSLIGFPMICKNNSLTSRHLFMFLSVSICQLRWYFLFFLSTANTFCAIIINLYLNLQSNRGFFHLQSCWCTLKLIKINKADPLSSVKTFTHWTEGICGNQLEFSRISKQVSVWSLSHRGKQMFVTSSHILMICRDIWMTEEQNMSFYCFLLCLASAKQQPGNRETKQNFKVLAG